MLKCMFTKGFVFGIIFLLFGTGLTNVFIEDLVIDAAASPVYSGWNNDPSRFSNLDASLDVIPVDDPQSPLQKYFTTQKILWSLDDYWINSHDYPPHKGYGGLTQRIINYGGYVQINSIFIPDWIGQYYGHAVRNYSVVPEFSMYAPLFSQDNIDKSLEFFNSDHIAVGAHDWNHSTNLNDATLDYAYDIINFTLWNWYNNYHIRPHLWLGGGSEGNYNISLALKRFSDTYWPVYAEAFTLLNPTTGEFPDGTSSAVEYIGKAYDPEFGVSWGTPCTTLGCAQAEYTTYALDRDILFIKGHPSILNDTGQEANLTLWQQFIDWIYTEHDLLNINHTEAIAYKYEERTNYTVIMNNAENYTIDLTGCRFNHNMYLTSPDNDGSLWTLYEESGTYIGEILGAGFLLFEKGHSYYLTAERNQPPVFGTPTPVDGSSNNPLSFTWSIPINDPNGNTFSWIIQCNNGQANSGTDASNGTKSLSLSGLVNSASYIILVNASDLTGSGQYTRRWYTFSTTGTMTNTPPVFGTPSPTNSSTGNSLSFTWSIPISDPEGNTFSWTIQCSNGQANSGTGAFNGTKSLSLSGLTNSTTYNIWVNATDPTGSGVYTRKWYTFTTQQQNLPPNKPSQPSGQANGTKKELYSYTTSTTDPNADKVYYQWDWGDGTTSEWLGPYNSGAVISTTHQWTTKGSFNIKVKAKDTSGAESSWSNPLPIKIRNWFINLILQILKWLFQRFPNVFPLLQQFMGY